MANHAARLVYDRQMNELEAQFVANVITEEEYKAGMEKLFRELKESFK